MTTDHSQAPGAIPTDLAESGYWPAEAAACLKAGKYSRAVEICQARLREQPGHVAGRILYARALYYAGQHESAAEQFYEVLARDSNNLVALKYVGDIKFADGDEGAAMANYERVLELDPDCQGLACELTQRPERATRTITLRRSEEKTSDEPPDSRIPFFTETIGDLYLAQGHNRLAAQVYRRLVNETDNPRLRDKLKTAEEKLR